MVNPPLRLGRSSTRDLRLTQGYQEEPQKEEISQMAYEITEEKRAWYRQISNRSRLRKEAAKRGELKTSHQSVNQPLLRPEELMPLQKKHGLTALSLFSGGGGLDLAFERAGFEHCASYDILEICGATLRANRPHWTVYEGSQGDVTLEDWSRYKGRVDVLHGGPPCQPFSVAGKQKGSEDTRDMWPAFLQAISTILPNAFVAENVLGLLEPKFASYVEHTILRPLASTYKVMTFCLVSSDFGLPQSRKRVFFVGFKRDSWAESFLKPTPTHTAQSELFWTGAKTMGVREALGLEEIGFDCFAPTLRSGFTGPRKSTSILNSKASQAVWERLQIWPNGVQKSREDAMLFPPENGHFRLSIQDCALLQGFPESWRFEGAVYQALGQIGNSVCPPVGYAVATAVAKALGVKDVGCAG